MMMRMLEAGGAPVWQDGIRAADDQNPHGYYELERVKDLDKELDKAWVHDGRGRAVKVISSLLEHLPRTNDYRVVFMQRDLDEILASQAGMLTQRGQTGQLGDDDTLRTFYEAHLRKVKYLLAHDPAFSSLEVAYADVLSDPWKMAARVSRFVGGDLDVSRMAAIVDQRLYRNRRAPR
jgi:hypothetical protein